MSDQVTVNRIYYGAPGTGKTYRLQVLQQQYTEQWVAQDDDSQNYDNIVTEKIRDLSWSEVICLVFLEEKRLLRVPEILHHPFMTCKIKLNQRHHNISQTVWATLMRHTAPDSKTVKYNRDKRSSLALFDKDTAGLWFLLTSAKSTLKPLKLWLDELSQRSRTGHCIERFSFVTFHQNYSYEDFIEGLRPVLQHDSRQIQYEIRRGIFIELCERARHHPEHAYALFIDEINRGNINKIFGELISLIELDKRAGTQHALEVTLPYSGQKFTVPNNLSIYASMNTADRSLTPIDMALRRRFEFIEVLPDYTELQQQLEKQAELSNIDIVHLLQVINERITLLLGRDYILGHSYFYHLQNFADLQQLMQQKIIPLLQDYFFDDWQKIRLILNDHRKSEHLQFIQSQDTEQRAVSLFGQHSEVVDQGWNSVPLQPIYILNPSALVDIRAYQLIYS